MATYYRLRGVPGCGKSTYAETLLASTPHTIRVNRDAIRREVFGYIAPDTHENRSREGLVTDFQRAMEGIAYHKLMNIVSDNTNGPVDFYLPREFRNMYSVVDVFFSTPIEECIARDAARQRSVGEEVSSLSIRRSTQRTHYSEHQSTTR